MRDSVRQSSRELYAHQIEVERLEIAEMPELETQELTLIYEAKGIPSGDARALAERLMSDDATALDAMAREELGIDPVELGGSAAVAALASFVPFTLGAAVPFSLSCSSPAPRPRWSVSSRRRRPVSRSAVARRLAP